MCYDYCCRIIARRAEVLKLHGGIDIKYTLGQLQRVNIICACPGKLVNLLKHSDQREAMGKGLSFVMLWDFNLLEMQMDFFQMPTVYRYLSKINANLQCIQISRRG